MQALIVVVLTLAGHGDRKTKSQSMKLANMPARNTFSINTSNEGI
jgi:hypothetical protein